MLSIGSFYDLKTREVDDRLWVIFGAAGLVPYALECHMYGVTVDVQMILASVSLTAAIAIALYRYGFFGGADAKALMAISVIMPVYYSPSSFYVHPITGIMVLTNAVLFAMAVPLYNALSNLIKVARGERIFDGFDEPMWKKILACFVGTPSSMPIRHHLVIECSSAGEGKKRFSFRLNCDEDDSDSKGSCYAGSYVGGRTWLSQNLPFLVFMLAGFLAVMSFGDLLSILLRHQ